MTLLYTAWQKTRPVSSALRAALNWSLSVIDVQNWVKVKFAKPRSTRYPVKLLRYWFMYNLIREERIRLGRPLRYARLVLTRAKCCVS